VKKRRWVVNNEDIPIATSKQRLFGIEFKKKLNIELPGFKIVNGMQQDGL
jgi:hypothetical protein